MQLSTETILWDDKAVTVAIADRNYGDPRVNVQKPESAQIIENGGDYPSILAPDCLKEIEALTAAAGRALGITRGTCKGDLIWTRKGPFVIEIAARLAPSEMAQLVEYGTGVNYVRAGILIALGEEPHWKELQSSRERYASVRSFFAKPGVIQEIQGVEAAMKIPGVAGVDLFAKVGDQVKPLSSHADRIGRFFVVGESRAFVRDTIERVYDTVRIITA